MNKIPQKRCSKGDNCAHPNGPNLPATNEYFSKHNQCKDGLRPHCKMCQKAGSQKYYAANKDQIILKTSQYQKDHPEQTRKINQRWEQNNHDKRLAQRKHRRLTNPEIAKASSLRHRLKYPEQDRVIKQRRVARKRNLPDNFSHADWERALNYFNGRCAICERQLRDLFDTHRPAADHWIPLTSPACPGTIPTNIIPLCHGISGCNNRKGNRDPIEFLETEFGKQKTKKILARIEAYFEWVRLQS